MKARMLRWALGLSAIPALCLAQVPSVINYQGRLVNGTNLYNGNVALSLQLWDHPTAGALLGEDSNTVAVVDGLYATVLGDDMPDGALARALNDNTNVYIRVLVNGTALSPRERLASAAYAVIPGLKGVGNVQAGARSAVGGGETNTALGQVSVIGGGVENRIGENAMQATIGGGIRNTVGSNAYVATIAGGGANTVATYAAYSAIGGGAHNRVAPNAQYAVVPGGQNNTAGDEYAFAAGRRARANHEGSFVWADSTDADFASTADKQFLIRAAGGVGINTNGPFSDALVVAGGIRASEAVHAESLVGEGSGITMLNGQNIQDGTISNLQLGVGSVTRSNLAVGSVSPDKLTEKYWAITGNNNVTAGMHFVGTTTTNPLELRVSNARVMRFENANVNSDPNVIGGHAYNLVTPGRVGSVIAGGGGFLDHNEVRDNYGAIGGGAGNVAGDNTSKEYATVAGGQNNSAEGGWSTIPGGRNNRASGFYALAAGRQAKAIHDGAFVWADSTATDFSSTASDQFIVRAAGGVGVNESDPRQQLSVGGYLDLYSGASNAPAQTSIRASSLGHLFLNARSDGSTFINYDSGNSLIVNPKGGRVGIGTNNPTRTLTVIGDGSFTGPVYAESFIGDGSGLTALDGGNIMAMTVTTDQLAQAYWRLDGNANAAAGTHFIGTVTAVPLDLYAYNTRVLRLGLNANVLGGNEANTVGGGANGATVAGGGSASLPNSVPLNYGTVGGGQGNTAGGVEATVAGGKANAASGTAAVVSGGRFNVAAGDVSAVGGGTNNTARGVSSVVGGGRGNYIGNEGDYAVIAGGISNYLDSVEATIGGGRDNRATEGAVAAGGVSNLANGRGSVVSGGKKNEAASLAASVGGGYNNRAAGTNSVVAGGANNTASHLCASVGGGTNNTAEGPWATVGGGRGNTAGGTNSVVGGGRDNRATGASSLVAGGEKNTASDWHATVGGGYGNVADDVGATVAGGGGLEEIFMVWLTNVASGRFSTIGGGGGNRALYDYATVAGGRDNIAARFQSTVGGGWGNVASGDCSVVSGGYSNRASGWYATMPGGRDNEAVRNYTLAAGRRARATNEGAFVWADSQDADAGSMGNDSVTFRCQGGARFMSGAGGANQEVAWVPGSGSWTFSSDRELKEGWAAVDGRAILDRLAELPISEWNYKGYAQRHIGPTAQDFHAAFPLNESDTTLNSLDLDGVALAAIQGLYQVVRDENAQLRQENETLRSRLAAIEERLGLPGSR